MNYRERLGMERPFDGLKPDEALRLYVYLTLVRQISPDDVAEWGYVPEVGALDQSKTIQILADVARDLERGSANDENVGWLDKYLQEGIRKPTEEEIRLEEQECLESNGYCSLSINNEFDNVVIVRNLQHDEIWLVTCDKTLSLLSRGICYELEKWAMYFCVVGKEIYLITTECDDSGYYVLCLESVKCLPEGCQCHRDWRLYEVLAAITTSMERELTDEQWNERDELLEQIRVIEE